MRALKKALKLALVVVALIRWLETRLLSGEHDPKVPEPPALASDEKPMLDVLPSMLPDERHALRFERIITNAPQGARFMLAHRGDPSVKPSDPNDPVSFVRGCELDVSRQKLTCSRAVTAAVDELAPEVQSGQLGSPWTFRSGRKAPRGVEQISGEHYEERLVDDRGATLFQNSADERPIAFSRADGSIAVFLVGADKLSILLRPSEGSPRSLGRIAVKVDKLVQLGMTLATDGTSFIADPPDPSVRSVLDPSSIELANNAERGPFFDVCLGMETFFIGPRSIVVRDQVGGWHALDLAPESSHSSVTCGSDHLDMMDFDHKHFLRHLRCNAHGCSNEASEIHVRKHRANSIDWDASVAGNDVVIVWFSEVDEVGYLGFVRSPFAKLGSAQPRWLATTTLPAQGYTFKALTVQGFEDGSFLVLTTLPNVRGILVRPDDKAIPLVAQTPK